MRETGGCGTTPFSLGMGRVRPNNPNSHIIVNDRSSKRVCYIPNHSNDVPLFLNKAEDVGATKVMFSDVNGEDSVVVSEYLYINSMRRSLYAHPVNGGEDVEYVSAEEGAGDFHTVRLYASGRDSALVTTSKTEFAFWNQDGEKTVIRDDLASLESPKPYNLIRGYDVDGDGDADIVTFVMDGVNREYRLEVITNDSV